MVAITRQTVAKAREDVGVFAEALIGQPLWPHQLELARSNARIRACCSGRQAGKSRTMGVVALHAGFAEPDRRILIISAGESAAVDLLAEVSMLAQSPLLAGSVVDDQSKEITLSNGSVIRSVPASVKQIRGRAVDLLIVDEAAFVDQEIWEAAKYTAIARPDSKIILASTPWGRGDRFFSRAYRAGMRGEPGHASFHWPSTSSPLVDTELLDIWRHGSSDREYRREVLAEWVDAAGQYFTDDEIENAVCDYPLVPPAQARRQRGFGGIDWGFIDSNAVVVVAEAKPGQLPGEWPRRTFYVPWIDEAVGVSYAVFVRRLVELTKGYRLSRLGSETNGVGQMPTQELQRLIRGRTRVVEVATTATSKQDGFGRLKVLLSQGRLALPRHPRLLSQLAALEFEERDSGTVRIEVPERSGHDDLAMALMIAMAQADVTSIPIGVRVQVAIGELPPIGLIRNRPGPSEVPPVRVVRPDEQVVRGATRSPSGGIVIPRRHPGYQPPGPR